MAINERVITGTTAVADGDAASVEQNLILHLDANDVDSYDGDGSVWYDISEHDITIPLSDNADDLEIHLNASDTTSYDPATDTTTWTDISGNSNDATLVSLTNTDHDIDNGGYFNLDGSSDYISLATSGIMSSDFTIEMWWYFDSLSGYQMLWGGQDYGSGGAGGLGHYIEDAKINTWVANGSASSVNVMTSGSVLSTSTWHHIVMTRSSGTVTVYVDGSSVGTGTYSGELTSANTKIGAHYHSSLYNVDGRVGAVREYEKALSASEVGQNYRHGRDYIYTALAADANLEQHLDPADTNSYSGTGTSWNDLEGTHANATVTASTYDEELGNSFDITSNTITLSGDAGSLDGTSFTFETWLWQDSNSGTQYFFSDTGISFFTISATQMRFIKYLSGTNNDTSYFNPANNGSGWGTNKWNHVAVTFSSYTAKIYINGILVHTEAEGSGTGTAISTYQISPSVGRWKGKIGQYRVYSTALTADEVMQNYLYTKNDYPNGYNGTITNAGWNSSGYFNFDGDNDIVTISGFYGSVNQSWVFWINPDTIERHFLASTYGSGIIPQGAMYVEMTSSGTIEAGVRNSSSTTSSVTTSTALTASNWHHIAVTSDGSDLKVYVNNGTPVSTTATVTSLASNSQSLVLCYDPRNIRLWFNGQISDFKAFDKALTSAEVTAEYNKGQFGEN